MLLAGQVCAAILLVAVVTAKDQCRLRSACGERSAASSRTEPKVSARVYGPGLRGCFNLPTRYFFVHVVDASGNNFTTASPKNLTVTIAGTQGVCSIWTQVLSRGDGLFIVRYKLFKTCPEAKLEVKFNGSPLMESPLLLKGPLYNDACSCPAPFEDWLLQTECPTVDPQISKDLSQFEEIDMRKMLREALRRFDRPGSVSFCHYAVIKNKVYRKCYGQHVGFNMFMDQILLFLARKVLLPDVEMLVNLGDWPLERKSYSGVHIPFFSWCGSEDSTDIVMPTYDLTESSLEMMGRVTLDLLSVQGNSGPVWKEKQSCGFWRGRDSRQERLDLVALSRRHPELLNASLTNFFFFRDKMDIYGPQASHVSFFDFFEYKYQINVDGTVAAYRLPYLLAGSSLVLKQDSKYYEHFYSRLIPMVHYVPFQRNLSDLIEKLVWAQEHDGTAQRIVKEAQQFALDHLLPHHVFCYYAQLLQQYSFKLKRRAKVAEGMEEVLQPRDNQPCDCRQQQRNHDEL
ncbi:hypothetical protein V5799_007583 [Amblyomma americanum]|uniref:Glycosyl transferase CAP10 domain-containing protein n=1 Tax=Amblyomma americanum TaxID=6943 RepID=A0AAQ4FHC5_AMBAM